MGLQVAGGQLTSRGPGWHHMGLHTAGRRLISCGPGWHHMGLQVAGGQLTSCGPEWHHMGLHVADRGGWDKGNHLPEEPPVASGEGPASMYFQQVRVMGEHLQNYT